MNTALDIAAMYAAGASTRQIASMMGVSQAWARRMLLAAGVVFRTRAEGIRLAASQGRIGNHGPRPPFSDEWKANIRAHRVAWGEAHAVGKTVKPDGYVEFTRGPNKGRSEHRVVMEQHLGRKLTTDEVVHHIDENPANNDISNLQVMTRSEHTAHHRRHRK